MSRELIERSFERSDQTLTLTPLPHFRSLQTVNGLGNSASIYSSYLFPSSDGPKYTMGLTVTTVFMASAAIGGQVLKYSLKKFPYPELEKMIPVREVDENKA